MTSLKSHGVAMGYVLLGFHPAFAVKRKWYSKTLNIHFLHIFIYVLTICIRVFYKSFIEYYSFYYEIIRRKVCIYEILRIYLPTKLFVIKDDLMVNKIQQPTNSELEILTILWEYGPSTVRIINERLNEVRKVGYTTTLKIMQIMHDKKLVIRVQEGKSHKYTAAIEENAIQNRLIDKMLDSAFGGSASRLVMQTLGNHKASQSELDEIRKLIDNLDKK